MTEYRKELRLPPDFTDEHRATIQGLVEAIYHAIAHDVVQCADGTGLHVADFVGDTIIHQLTDGRLGKWNREYVTPDTLDEECADMLCRWSHPHHRWAQSVGQVYMRKKYATRGRLR